MDKITINCDIFLRQQHSSQLLPALYWPCFTRNIFFIQSLTHLLYPTMKNINISTKTPKKSSFYRRNNKIFQTICFAFANACAVRSTYSFLYVWFGLSQRLRFLPKDRRLGERDCRIPNLWTYEKYLCMVQSKNVLYNKFIDTHFWFIFLHKLLLAYV
jgi:hypothetical protein